MRARSRALLVAVSLLVMLAGFVPAAGAEGVTGLSVTVVDSAGGFTELGRDCTYTITVTNTGEVDLIDVIVEDTFLGAVGEVAVLEAGQSVQFTKTIVMRDPGSGTCTVTARGPQGEEVVASFDHRVELFIGDTFSDLSVTKHVVAGSAVPGGTLRYRVVVANLGQDEVDADALTCDVVDDFDQNRMTVLDAGGGTISAGILRWTLDVPGPGKSTTIEYSLRIKADATGTIVNTVAVEYPLDPSDANNTATVRTPVKRPTASGGDTTAGGSGGQGAKAAASLDADEPFLPFTGAPTQRMNEIALAFLILGFALRATATRGQLS